MAHPPPFRARRRGHPPRAPDISPSNALLGHRWLTSVEASATLEGAIRRWQFSCLSTLSTG
eukprot:9490741-Pyramimonas_sp.AAC.1